MSIKQLSTSSVLEILFPKTEHKECKTNQHNDIFGIDYNRKCTKCKEDLKKILYHPCKITYIKHEQITMTKKSLSNIVCKACNKTLSSVQSFKRHSLRKEKCVAQTENIRMKRKFIFNFLCNSCGQSFAKPTNHSKSCKGKENIKHKVCCRMCEKYYNSKYFKFSNHYAFCKGAVPDNTQWLDITNEDYFLKPISCSTPVKIEKKCNVLSNLNTTPFQHITSLEIVPGHTDNPCKTELQNSLDETVPWE